MNLEKTFKKVILFDVVVLVVGIIFAFYPSETVERANEFLDQNNWYNDNEGSYLIFIYSLIVLTISNLFMGEYALTVFDLFFLDISAMLSGAILIFLYFTNLSKKFK